MPKKRNGPFKFWKDAAFVDQIGKVEAWLLNEMGSGSILKSKTCYVRLLPSFEPFWWKWVRKWKVNLPLEQIAMF